MSVPILWQCPTQTDRPRQSRPVPGLAPEEARDGATHNIQPRPHRARGPHPRHPIAFGGTVKTNHGLRHTANVRYCAADAPAAAGWSNADWSNGRWS